MNYHMTAVDNSMYGVRSLSMEESKAIYTINVSIAHCKGLVNTLFNPRNASATTIILGSVNVSTDLPKLI
jgi:hypothetical protein